MLSPRSDGLHTEGGLKLMVVNTIFQSLAVAAVGLRVWAKYIIGREFQLHDYLIFAALLWSLGFYVLIIAAGNPGAYGMHIWDVEDPAQITAALKGFYASFYVWITATALVKLSILHLYSTVFSSPGFRKVAISIAVTTILFWASYILVALLICYPIRKNWQPEIDGKCGSTVGQEIASATINMILDAAITLAPLPLLWGLQMSKKKKLILSGIIGAGSVICAMNATRVAIEAITASSSDFTYNISDIGLFAGLETWIGIIVACAPLLGPVFFSGRPGFRTRIRGYSYQKHTPSSSRAIGQGNPNGASRGGKSWWSTGGDTIALSSVDKSSEDPNKVSYWAGAQNVPRSESDSTNAPNQSITVETEVQVVKSIV